MDAGVREYWIVDPEKERTTIYRYEEDAVPMIIPPTANNCRDLRRFKYQYFRITQIGYVPFCIAGSLFLMLIQKELHTNYLVHSSQLSFIYPVF